MKILLVWKDDYPWDIRVEKICLTLISFGYEVHIAARNVRRKKIFEIIKKIKVHRLNKIINYKLNTLLSMPVFFNPLWNRNISNLCKKYKYDLIIIRDLPLVKLGISIGNQFGIPTIFDMAENYPAMWSDVIWDQWYKAYNFIVKNPLLGKALEKYCVKNVDHIFTVIEESKDRLVQMGVNRTKISIVSNTPDLKEFNYCPDEKKQRRWKNRTVILYEGFVNRSRGLDVVIKSLPELTKKYPSLLFVVVGDGKYLFKLKELSAELNVKKYVQFLGWVSFRKIPGLIRNSDICMIPHYKTPHKNTTIPNKLFDYMACNKPVVVSNAGPLKRIVGEEKCGIVFESGNKDCLINSLAQLVEYPNLQKEMGMNGRKAVEQNYNWENDSGRLKQAVESIIND